MTQAAFSRWESGDREPSRDAYTELWLYAGEHKSANLFYEKSGLTKAKLQRMLNVFNRDLGQLPVDPSEVVTVPLLKNAVAAGEPRDVLELETDESLVFSRKLCPHPESTRCIKVVGESMSPVLRPGYIVAIDTKEREPKRLVGKMVAAGSPDGGVTLKWLRKVGRELVLLPQHTSIEYNPVLLSREPGWRIIGRVLFWIGKPG